MSWVEQYAKNINFTVLQRYLVNRGWEKKNSKRDQIAIYFKNLPSPSEILLPFNSSFSDYNNLIKKAIKIISENEQRPQEVIINDLLLPPSDTIRFRVVNEDTEHGIIPFNDGFSLLENAKKSLIVAACDIASPAKYHKKLSNKRAQQFIDSCYLGHTEKGSFIAVIVCPFINSANSDKPNVLSLFNSENELYDSDTRHITKKYMQSLNTIKNKIENDDHYYFENLDDKDIISANFFESLLDLSDYGDNEVIEISASWSVHCKDIPQVENKVSFNKDFVSPIESILNRLRPKFEEYEGTFVGQISQAKADPDPSSRTECEIIFSYINDDKAEKAKVILHPDDFSKACTAFDKGANVMVKGKMQKSGRTRTIINTIFQVIE